MTITIKLDTPSMNALFPEGSEARVELQKAVLANFCASALKPSWLGAAVISAVELAKAEAIKTVLREMGALSGYGSTLTIPDALRLKFKEEAKAAVESSVAPLIKEAVLERTQKISDGVAFEVGRKVNTYMEEAINEVVRVKLQKAFKLATQ